MKKIKVAIIGAGNISNTRHIPALKKLKHVEIVGVIGGKQKNLDRTMKKYNIKNSLLLGKNSFAEKMNKCEWLKNVDAVAIGAPPKEHFALVEASLLNNKHVLVEKPMTMNTEEADTLTKLSREMNKVFCVMHNFQYTSGMQKLEKIMQSGELGKIVSFYELQLTNKNRRLPEWYNDLPLGLFYDEAPHFIYLLEKYGGDIKLESAYAQFNEKTKENTPIVMNVMAKAGKYPVDMYLNFESPICEWHFMVLGDKKVAIYDLFKDILIVLPTDNEHYAMDVLKNSFRSTIQFWSGFVINGFKMINGNLLYGHDVVMRKFIDSVIAGELVDGNISSQNGKSTIAVMNNIVDLVNESR